MRRLLSTVAVASLSLSLAVAPAWADPTPSASPFGPAVTKSPTGSYIVVMKAKPLVTEFKTTDLDSSSAKKKRAGLRQSHASAMKAAGIKSSKQTADYTNVLNGFAVSTDLAGATKLAHNKSVAVVLPDEIRQATSIAEDFAAANKNRAGVNGLNNFLGLSGRSGAYGKGITGQGTIVGVVDTGIWPENPMFAPQRGMPAPPVLDDSERSACDFGNTAWNPNDKPFTCNNKLVGAREFLDTYKAYTGLEPYEFDSARDNEGHGTHTASTAAGDANVRAKIFGVDKGIVSGIAPRAQIIAYKALGDLGGYTSDLSAAIDQAVADGVDVINYSIGGGARVVSGDTIAFLFAADAGVFASVSAGNSGPGAKTIGGPADVPWVTAVGATTYSTFYQGVVKLGNGRHAKTYLGASVTRNSKRAQFVDAADAGLTSGNGSDLCLSGTLDPAKVKGKIVLCGRGQNGRIAKSFEVQQAGGVGMVLYNQTDIDNLFTDNFFVPAVMVDNTTGTAIRSWVKSSRKPVGQLVNTGIGTAPFYTPSVAYFSSRGENAPAGDIIKPDIAAPGVQIMAGNTPMPSPGTQPAGQNFQAIAGTSMAAPVVAGSYALLKQAHPDWSAAAAKSALMTSAGQSVRDSDRVTKANPFATGSGLALVGRPGHRGSAFEPGLVYDASFNDYLGFLCAEGREAFADADATCAALAAAGIATTAADLNYASIGNEAVPGTSTVKRTVTNVSSRTIRVHAAVSAPSGYSINVTPSTLAVAPGDSADFTVTMTNTSAPLGAWRFGSLSWKGDGYDVRSPIAVKGVAIHAPTDIAATGASGSTTLDVSIGVNGTYQATAHGLVPATDNNGVISQDPDQTYPSGDDGAGVVKIPFTLTDVDLAQWSLVLNNGDDLDLYLLGPDGSVIASSTNGGTDEQIRLWQPANGQYTMVVHGWLVSEPNTPFDLRSWLVPSASGGSLSVTPSGPVSVSSGDSVSVQASWSGLNAGTDYLGSVSHTLNGEIAASTAISVTG